MTDARIAAEIIEVLGVTDPATANIAGELVEVLGQASATAQIAGAYIAVLGVPALTNALSAGILVEVMGIPAGNRLKPASRIGTLRVKGADSAWREIDVVGT